MSSWLWPTSEDQFHRAEQDLLRDVWNHEGLDVEQTSVEIAPGNSINTLRVRMKGKGEGAGPKKTLVFAHGFGSGIGLWHRNLSEIVGLCDGEVEILAFDWPGFGRSSRVPYDLDSFETHFPLPKEGEESPSLLSPPPSSSSPSSSPSDSSSPPPLSQETLERVEKAENYFIESLEKWREQLNLDDFVLLGHSLGGYFSSLYALRYPERVSSLILASPVGMPERPAETAPPRRSLLFSAFRQSWRLSISPQAFVRSAGPFGPRLVNWFCEKRFGFEGEEANRVSSYLYHTSVAPPSGEYSLFDVIGPGVFAHRPLVNRLPDLSPSVPLHFIYGRHDWMDFRSGLSVSNARKEGGGLAGEVFRVSESGHQMYLENSYAFNLLVCNLCLKKTHRVDGVLKVSEES